MLYGELGREPLKLIIHKRMIAYWSKLVQSSNLYASIVYRSMRQSNLTFKWLNHIKHIFDSTGNSNLFENQFNVDVKMVSYSISKTLKDQNLQL